MLRPQWRGKKARVGLSGLRSMISLLLVVYSFSRLYLGVGFLKIHVSWDLLSSWNCELVSVISSGTFLDIISSNIAFVPIFLSFPDANEMHVRPFESVFFSIFSFFCLLFKLNSGFFSNLPSSPLYPHFNCDNLLLPQYWVFNFKTAFLHLRASIWLFKKSFMSFFIVSSALSEFSSVTSMFLTIVNQALQWSVSKMFPFLKFLQACFHSWLFLLFLIIMPCFLGCFNSRSRHWTLEKIYLFKKYIRPWIYTYVCVWVCEYMNIHKNKGAIFWRGFSLVSASHWGHFLSEATLIQVRAWDSLDLMVLWIWLWAWGRSTSSSPSLRGITSQWQVVYLNPQLWQALDFSHMRLSKQELIFKVFFFFPDWQMP